MNFRCIKASWADPVLPNVKEGDFTEDQIASINKQGYNIYFLPNHPSEYPSGTVYGAHIDVFNFVFVDMDLKAGKYTKESFTRVLREYKPTYIVDSGRGIHAYWRVSDLDAMSYLRLQRCLCRALDTDEAVAKIFQLMRVPGTLNTKDQYNQILCKYIYEGDEVYTSEEMANMLPPLTKADEEYCLNHFQKTYRFNEPVKVSDKMPLKFAELVRSNKEVKEIWAGGVDDRSRADYRLGHIMFGNGFSREEALSVLVNSSKAISRAPARRLNYATGIVDKIWTFELSGDSGQLDLSEPVSSILKRTGDALKGTRLPCWRYIDATAHGFRLGQVIGLVAGSGVGKTAVAMNMFLGFVQNNPDLEHFFVPLEQPSNEIADRWKTICGKNINLHDKVHIISNYAEDGSFRNLSLEEIKNYLVKFQEVTKRKIGCVVIDHIGALKKAGKDGRQNIEDICHEMKAFAIQTNTLLVMQSQTSREKAGIGDLELGKDAAYGTVFFESYCDYLITIWQPLKRCYSEPGCPTVTAFKFCKIRHKKKNQDEIQEDVCYRLLFDSETEHLRELTQQEEASFDFFNNKALNARKRDRKTDLVPYSSIKWSTNEPIKINN